MNHYVDDDHDRDRHYSFVPKDPPTLLKDAFIYNFRKEKGPSSFKAPFLNVAAGAKVNVRKMRKEKKNLESKTRSMIMNLIMHGGNAIKAEQR